MRGLEVWRMLVAGLLGVVVAGGCYPRTGHVVYMIEAAKAERPVRWDRPTPYARIGGVPYDLDLVAMDAIDANDLGRHVYYGSVFEIGRGEEQSQGMIYTRRAGFIDLAHTRNAMDLTWYAYLNLIEGLEHPDKPIVIKASEPSVYLLHWSAALRQAPLAETDKQRLALVQAQRVAYVMSTWHEIITYAGFKGAGLVPESQSAFTWDDPPSNMLGVLVAGEAIAACQASGQATEQAFNRLATQSLARWMEALEPVTAEQTRLAAAERDGVWYAAGEPLKRMMHVGVDDAPIKPWLVQGAAFKPRGPVVQWALPGGQIHRINAADALVIQIKPYIMETGVLAQAVGREESGFTVDVMNDFPTLSRQIAAREREAGRTVTE